MAIQFTDEDKIKELEQIKEDSIQIEKMINELQKSMHQFANKYGTQRIMGEVVYSGIDDVYITRIKESSEWLENIRYLFESFPKMSDRAIEVLKNPIDESILNQFR